MSISTQRENRKNTRVQLKEPLKVVLSAIGSDMRYELFSKDISAFGVSLVTLELSRLPFTTSTLLEVWLELPSNRVIFFVGKLVRFLGDEDQSKKGDELGVAVKILQISPEHQLSLNDFLAQNINQEA